VTLLHRSGPSWRIVEGDCRESMRALDAGSVQTCVTSPPYLGLRDYGHVGQIGNERNLLDYITNLRDVFRETWRVLRDDGTLWLNLGDSYDKNKSLIGVPWKVAQRLKQDGWIIRCDVIWANTNPMPEPVKDRPTRAHEYVFLLSKNAQYYYDADAIREEYSPNPGGSNFYARTGTQRPQRQKAKASISGGGQNAEIDNYVQDGIGRNKRSVWQMASKPYRGMHGAVFPPELPELCVLAGSKEGDTVLDPFSGSGTTGIVSLRHGRSFVGCELNPEYVRLGRDRIISDSPLLNAHTEAA
jgi:DNA modification methylase